MLLCLLGTLAYRAEPITMGDYAMPCFTCHSSIRMLKIEVESFKIDSDIILMIMNSVQFKGLPTEYAYAHVGNILEICDLCKYEGIPNDAIRLRLFSVSLRDGEKN